MSKGTAHVTVTEKFVFFWRGYPGQWFRSPFTLDGVAYTCAEQAMMAAKARMFGDNDTLRKIMAADKPSEQKALGRQVRGFIQDQWDKASRDIVTRVNVAKFSQDPELKQQLLDTGDRQFVEASPVDCIWGVGLSVEDPNINDRAKWRGTNWLGECLVRARKEIREGRVVTG